MSDIKSVKHDPKKNELTIVMSCDDPPKPSGSGKSLMVATTRGNKRTDVDVNGETLTVSVNAYIPNADYDPEAE